MHTYLFSFLQHLIREKFKENNNQVWFLFLSQLFQKLISRGSNANCITCNQNMEQSTQTTTTTTTNQTKTTAQPIKLRFEDSDDDDFDLIEFGIASNGGRLSMKGA
jgi:hypothetical protein